MVIDDPRRPVTHILQCFLDSALERQFVILENGGDDQGYVQFKLNHGILYGEVGSREWVSPDARRPLDADARDSLAALGFHTAVPCATTSATTSRKARHTWPTCF